MRPACILLACLATAVLAVPPDVTPPAAPPSDEQLLKDNKVAVDGPGLLEFFRSRTLDAGDAVRIKAVVRRLGDDDFDAREEASRQLTALGLRAKPFLATSVNDPDPEIAWRARECLRCIEEAPDANLVAAAVRVLALRKPAGAAEVLLNYLASAADETLAEEVRVALSDLAVQDRKPDPALAAALTDKSAVKRAAAAVALCRAGAVEQLPPVRKLLQDPEPVVRYRAALALASLGEKDAVPVLIALLDQPSPSTSRVEEFLYRVADNKALPPPPAGTDAASRRKFRDAWKAWWDDNGAKVETARMEEVGGSLGCTLVVLLDAGRVVDLDGANRTRFQIDQLQFPLDAQLLPDDHVLVAEHNGNRVTERNRKNEVVWEKKIDGPLVAQRLPNGNTFIATHTEVVEFKPNGDEVFNYTRPNGEAVMKAQKLRNGDIAVITQLGASRFVLLDSKGKELRSFPVDQRTSGGRIDVLPNGNILMPENANNRVVELDTKGQQVWEVTVEQPIAAVRLPNGNTLITSMNQHRAIEVDREGKEVWQYKQDTRVTRAFRR